MKKIFICLTLISLMLLVYIYFSSPYLNFYNVEFLHPLFWTLIPITCLLFLCIFLNNISQRSFFSVLAIFGVIDFIILSEINTTCSQIVCYDRSSSALLLSSLFSIIFFIILLFRNKKQSTLV